MDNTIKLILLTVVYLFGLLLVVGGIVLSSSIIGAIIGIPLALVGLVIIIIAGVYTYKIRAEIFGQKVGEGVRKELSKQTVQSTDSVEKGLFCPNCGGNISPDDKFCKSCGQKL